MGSMACAFYNNAGVYLTSYTDARTSLAYIFLLHNRLPLAYIHQMESDLPPTSYSVSEELHLHSRPQLIQYAALAADAHACTTERRSWGKKACHFPVSNL